MTLGVNGWCIPMITKEKSKDEKDDKYLEELGEELEEGLSDLEELVEEE